MIYLWQEVYVIVINVYLCQHGTQDKSFFRIFKKYLLLIEINLGILNKYFFKTMRWPNFDNL